MKKGLSIVLLLHQPVNIEELAKLVNMSVTSFHRQFKAVTGMSPLQYQKRSGCRKPGG